MTHRKDSRWRALLRAAERAAKAAPATEPSEPGRRELLRRPLAWAALAGILAVPLILFFLYGYRSGPRAPALVDEPVYQNQQEGFRFFPPDGWRIQGRAEFPSGGQLKEERLLVEYRRAKQGDFAALVVSMVDLPEGQAVSEYLQPRQLPKDTWRFASLEPITVAGQSAERFRFTGKQEKTEVTREILALRRGGRVYFFSAVYSANDPAARDEVRKAIASLSWSR